MNCKEIEELAGAYALDALPAEMMRAVEEHLASCEAHPEIASLRAVAGALAAAAPEREPPAALKARIMDTVLREAAAERPHQAPHARALRLPRIAWPRLSPAALTTALAIVAAGLLGWNVYLQTSGDGDGGALVRTLSDGGAVSGRIVYVEDQGLAVMTVEGLTSLAEDKTYQVWAISDGTPAGIGLFSVGEDGRASASMEVDLAGVDIIAVTIEPAGGSPKPTSDPVLAAEI